MKARTTDAQGDPEYSSCGDVRRRAPATASVPAGARCGDLLATPQPHMSAYDANRWAAPSVPGKRRVRRLVGIPASRHPGIPAAAHAAVRQLAYGDHASGVEARTPEGRATEVLQACDAPAYHACRAPAPVPGEPAGYGDLLGSRRARMPSYDRPPGWGSAITRLVPSVVPRTAANQEWWM
ncbi:hypothetical protein [Kribbella sp. NPDC000426]|uniref:hypothetical protein n=1 Tax=Kribbella sp. NPDC000426 TaxID=3154255 RepID=UPI00331CBC68